jgi:DNA segregation ATPase FtsK/SpoIIIE, S-DNA-T family
MNRQQLERKADAIEMVLYQHQTPGKITGGNVTPRWVQFLVQPGPQVKADRVEALSIEIAQALGVPFAKVTRRAGVVRIDVPRNDPQPLKLVNLIERLHASRVPQCTAVLGLADDGAPLLARFPSPEVGHMLISGKAGSGKTSLIIAMLLSLAHYNQPRHVQIVAMGSGLAGLRDLPHMLEVNELQRLIARPGNDPRVMVAIDEPRAADLPVVRAMIERGPAVGVHCIVATREPVDLPVNVKITADRQPGDFWAEYSGAVVRFDAAHIATHEIGSFIQALK